MNDLVASSFWKHSLKPFLDDLGDPAVLIDCDESEIQELRTRIKTIKQILDFCESGSTQE